MEEEGRKRRGKNERKEGRKGREKGLRGLHLHCKLWEVRICPLYTVSLPTVLISVWNPQSEIYTLHKD